MTLLVFIAQIFSVTYGFVEYFPFVELQYWIPIRGLVLFLVISFLQVSKEVNPNNRDMQYKSSSWIRSS